VGRAWAWWYLTFGVDPSVGDVCEHLSRSLSGADEVDVVPRRWLHLTLLEVGFMDAVTASTLEGVAESARHALSDLARFELTLGPATVMPGAVVLEARSDALEPLRDRLRAAAAEAACVEPLAEPAPFQAHVSLGYLNRSCPPGRLLDRVAATDPDTISTTVDHVTLASVVRTGRHYEWEPLAQIALEGH
jgi:2'-5' RNA ligase